MKPNDPKQLEPVSRGNSARGKFPVIFGAVLGIVAAGGLLVYLLGKPGATGPKETGPTTSAGATNLLNVGISNAVSQPAQNTQEQQSNDSVELLAHGTELLNAGRPKEALAVFHQTLKLVPEDEDLHYNMGIAYARLGNKTNAVKHYEEALRIFPDYPEVHINLGNLLMDEGKFPKAMEHFEKAIELQPESSSAHNNLGTAHARQGQVNEAVVQFMKAIELNPDYLEARCNLGNAYFSQNRLDEAAAEFKEVLNQNPRFDAALRGMTRVQQKKVAR